MTRYIRYTRNELLQECKEMGLKRYSTMRKDQRASLLTEYHKKKEEKDMYTQDLLRRRYQLHRTYVQDSIALSKEAGIRFRFPSIPEDITENLIRFTLHRTHDPTSEWKSKNTGDLFSLKEGKQECKCFTSVGPISFTPSSDWNVIYFLDATRWLEDHFILYRAPLRMSSPEWKAIRINKKQTYGDQSDQRRRPRIRWSLLQPQLAPFLQRIAQGTFEELLHATPITI